MISLYHTVLLVTFVALVTAVLQGVEPEAILNSTIQVWVQKYDGNTVNFAPIEGKIVDRSEPYKQNKIVVIRGCSLPYEPQFRKEVNMGARAIICARDTQRSYIGEEMYANDGSDHSSITIPIVSVSLDDFDEFFLKPANGSIVIVRIITEPNNFMEVYGSVWMWVWQISLACYFVFNAGFSCFRLFQLYQLYGDCRLSVGVAAVTSCLIASIILFLGFSIDPFGSRQIFPVWLIRFLFIQHLPFVIAPMFLMALWWHAILASLKFQIQGSLPKYKWYAFAWIAFLIVFNITFALLNAFEKIPAFLYTLPIASLNFISFISILTYCIVTLYLLKKRVNNVHLHGKEKQTQLRKIIFSLYAVISSIVVVIVLYVLLVTGITNTPKGVVLYYFFFWLGLSVLITIELIVLQPPKRITVTSSGSHPQSRVVDVEVKSSKSSVGKEEEASRTSTPPPEEISVVDEPNNVERSLDSTSSDDSSSSMTISSSHIESS